MKNRDNLYLVERRATQGNYNVICGAYDTEQGAQDEADAMTQKFKDKGLDDQFSFHVIITTYYEV